MEFFQNYWNDLESHWDSVSRSCAILSSEYLTAKVNFWTLLTSSGLGHHTTKQILTHSLNAVFWFDWSFSLLIIVRKCIRCNIFLVFFAKEWRFMPHISLVFSLVTLNLFWNTFHEERELRKAVSSHNMPTLKAV